MNTHTQVNPTELNATIKLGIDAHATWFYVGRQLNGPTPQLVQKITFDGLLRFVAKQQGNRVHGQKFVFHPPESGKRDRERSQSTNSVKGLSNMSQDPSSLSHSRPPQPLPIPHLLRSALEASDAKRRQH